MALAATTDIEPINESIEQPSTVVNKTPVTFYFNGDCWVNIYDATGEHIAWGVKKADYVMNIEPIYEFYDLSKDFDLVAVKYIEKRNWLRGYYTSLLDLEKKGVIKIFEKLRLFGSLYHETYNFIIWKKL